MADPIKPNLELTEQPAKSLAKQPGLKTATLVLRGPWEEIEELADQCRVGFAAPTRVEGAVGRVAAATATRQSGGYGTLELATTQREETETWNLDFLEIQKPIRNWKADAENPDDRPNMTDLAAWERLKTLDGAWEAYSGFYKSTEMSSSTQLSGNTLKLARKIFRGVEAFSLYTPVLTRVSVVNDLSALEGLGKDIGTVCAPTGGDDIVGSLALGTLTGLAKQWLKTADRLQGALDGSFQRVEVWTGADMWDGDLYPGGTKPGDGDDPGGGEDGGGGNESGGGDDGDLGDDFELPETPDLDVPELPEPPDL